MEERWKIQDMTREVKRKKMRGEFTGPTDVSTELFVKMVIKHQSREEKWKKDDTERLKKRIEYRKKHPRKEKEDRRWIALTKGTPLTKGPSFNEPSFNETFNETFSDLLLLHKS